MAVRILFVLAALAVLYGCGQVSSPAEKQEKQGSADETQPKTATEGDPWSACAADRTSQQPFVLSYADDIWTMDIDGSNRQQLTATGEVEGSTVEEGQPAWSPNHEWIAFFRSHYSSTSESAEPEGQSAIYVMNHDGSCQTKLVANAYQPTWSPDGKKIAFSKLTSIYIMNADGSGEPQRLTTKHLASDGNPAWSPDGKKMAFVRDRHIYIIDCCEDEEGSTNEAKRLTDGSGKHLEPAWSPDGTELAFIHSSFRRTKGLSEPDRISTDVYKIDADGSGETRLTDTYSTKRREYGPVWSPEGDKLAFVEGNISGWGSEYSSTIYLMESDGSRPTVVTRVSEEGSGLGLDWQ